MKRFALLLCSAMVLLGARVACGEFIFTDAQPETSDTAVTSDVFAAPYGDDNNPGTLEAPVQTLRRALQLVITSQDTTPITVWLRGGLYPVTETLVLAGPFSREITIAAYPGEEPIITGATQVTNWSPAQYQGTDIWSATIDAQEIRALYGEDGARSIARWPKEGMLEVAKPATTADDKFDNQTSFFVNVGDVPASLSGATVRLLHWWHDELSGVRQYDPLTGLLTMNRPTAMTIMQGDRFWFENVLSLSLAPGEWAFDTTTHTLYYMPQEGETPENTPLYVGVNERLLMMNSVYGFSFEGITFARNGWSIPNYDMEEDFGQAAYNAGAAIFVGKSQNVRFTSCTFRDIGSGCILFGELVKNVSVTNCTFTNIGAQAVYVHGVNLPYDNDRTEGIVIENNEINGYGRNFISSAAILIVHARDVDINHNDIHDGTYTAVSAGWVWGDGFNATDSVRIRNNHIYYIGQGLLSDMGAIYMLGSQPNSLVSGNIIHDVSACDYGGWGIYLDEGSSGITVSHNLVYRCSSQGFHLHNASGNLVENNIFAFNQDGQVGGSGKGSFTLERNIMAGGKPYLNRPDTITIKTTDNIYSDDGSIFVDAEQGNFNLIDDPEISEKGFVSWVYNAGRYVSE